MQFIPNTLVPKVNYANFLRVECDEETHNLKWWVKLLILKVALNVKSTQMEDKE